jgi:hypothetical protein
MGTWNVDWSMDFTELASAPSYIQNEGLLLEYRERHKSFLGLKSTGKRVVHFSDPNIGRVSVLSLS